MFFFKPPENREYRRENTAVDIGKLRVCNAFRSCNQTNPIRRPDIAHLILPFPEALELATAEKPLPAPVERVSCTGSTVFVSVNPEAVMSKLPKLLRAATPKVRLALRFLTFHAGVATFELFTDVLSLPVHRLINLLTTAISVPEGVKIDKGASAPRVTVDLQRFIDQQVSGLTLSEFYIFEGDVVVVATLRDFRTRPAEPR